MTTKARRTKNQVVRKCGGLETTVDAAAVASLVIGICLAVIMMLALFPLGILAAMFVLWHSFLLWLLLRCLGEHLRLQKKIAGCSYDGDISGPIEQTVWRCGNCGQLAYSDESCDVCHAEFENTEPSD